jgi:hypothetical protein
MDAATWVRCKTHIVGHCGRAALKLPVNGRGEVHQGVPRQLARKGVTVSLVDPVKARDGAVAAEAESSFRDQVRAPRRDIGNGHSWRVGFALLRRVVDI